MAPGLLPGRQGPKSLLRSRPPGPAHHGRLSGVTGPSQKADLRRYLQAARDALAWKLDGLSEYQIRRPMTATGTSLLGLVKHMAGVEFGYFGEAFARPYGEPMPWAGHEDEPNADMWATADETREQIIGLYQAAQAHSDATIGELSLEAPGHVPWWPDDRNPVTLHQILVHVIAEAHRHAGHADIVRELIDGAAGLQAGPGNLPPGDQAWWSDYRDTVERAARAASARPAR